MESLVQNYFQKAGPFGFRVYNYYYIYMFRICVLYYEYTVCPAQYTNINYIYRVLSSQGISTCMQKLPLQVTEINNFISGGNVYSLWLKCFTLVLVVANTMFNRNL